jgi:hypothetical protein
LRSRGRTVATNGAADFSKLAVRLLLAFLEDVVPERNLFDPRGPGCRIPDERRPAHGVGHLLAPTRSGR